LIFQLSLNDSEAEASWLCAHITHSYYWALSTLYPASGAAWPLVRCYKARPVAHQMLYMVEQTTCLGWLFLVHEYNLAELHQLIHWATSVQVALQFCIIHDNLPGKAKCTAPHSPTNKSDSHQGRPCGQAAKHYHSIFIQNTEVPAGINMYLVPEILTNSTPMPKKCTFGLTLAHLETCLLCITPCPV